MAMSYEYDVFLSYPQKAKTIEDWVLTKFKPLFEDYLGSELGSMPRIFVDQVHITPGESWPDSLRFALARSRCLIGVWTPLYFTSEWCCREFAVMLHRGRQLGLTSVDNPSGLAMPVCAWDGDSFPSCIENLQHLDCRPYVIIGECFEASSLFMEFQQRLRDWVPRVADIIRSVPEWREEWATTDWMDVPYQDLLIATPRINQPRMV